MNYLIVGYQVTNHIYIESSCQMFLFLFLCCALFFSLLLSFWKNHDKKKGEKTLFGENLINFTTKENKIATLLMNY